MKGRGTYAETRKSTTVYFDEHTELTNRPLVTLVRPPALMYKWSDAGPLTPPIGVAYLAASLINSGIQTKIIDGIGENPNQVTRLDNQLISIGLTPHQICERIDPETTVVGVSVMFSQDWLECRKIIGLIREKYPDILIIAGGEHISALGRDILKSTPDIDVSVKGEGEKVIVDLVVAHTLGNRLESVRGIVFRRNGEITATKPADRIKNINDIPKPAWDLIPLETYLSNGLSYGVNIGRTIPLIATRGCPYQCTFCSNVFMWSTSYVMRDPDDLLDEIRKYIELYRATNFDFYDLTMVVKRSWIVEFTEKIKKRGLEFTWQLPSGTRSEALDKEVLSSLFETGCRNITYAPESGSTEELIRIKKKVDLSAMLISMRLAVQTGLNIKANIILGFPDQTRKDAIKTVIFIIRMAITGVQDVSVSMFSPYPGTELFEELRQSKKVTLDDEYYLSLAGYKDLSKSTSYTNFINGKEMALYRFVSLIIFYMIQFTLRPLRFVRLITNLVEGKERSRLDKSLNDLARRIRATG